MFFSKPKTSKDRFQVPNSCVMCSLMTDSGYLYFFQKQLLFVPKPMYWRPFSRLDQIDFKDSLMRKNTFEARLPMEPFSFALAPFCFALVGFPSEDDYLKQKQRSHTREGMRSHHILPHTGYWASGFTSETRNTVKLRDKVTINF